MAGKSRGIEPSSWCRLPCSARSSGRTGRPKVPMAWAGPPARSHRNCFGPPVDGTVADSVKPNTTIVDDYLELGLALGRHIDGLVDAYYGPAELAARVTAEPVQPPAALAER